MATINKIAKIPRVEKEFGAATTANIVKFVEEKLTVSDDYKLAFIPAATLQSLGVNTSEFVAVGAYKTDKTCYILGSEYIKELGKVGEDFIYGMLIEVANFKEKVAAKKVVNKQS